MVYRVLNYYAISTVFLLLRVHGTEQAITKDDLSINFTIESKDNAFICKPDGESNLAAEVGNVLRIQFKSSYYIDLVNCTSSSQHFREDIEELNVTSSPNDNYQSVAKLINITNNSGGPWLCQPSLEGISDSLKRNTTNILGLPECRFNITIKGTAVPQEKSIKKDPDTLYYIGAGILFIVIIVIQTAVIVYFKKKTQSVARIETLSQQIRNAGDNDNKRYSAPPEQKRRSLKTLFGKKSNKDDNGIYETLEELQMGSLSPPIPPIENIPSLKRKKATEKDISKRPPLPLPLTKTPKFVEPSGPVDRENARRPLVQIPVEPKPIQKEAKLPPPPNPKPKVPKSRAEVTTNTPAPVPTAGNQTTAKQFTAPANVTSELDSILKKRLNKFNAPSSDTAPPSGTLPCPANNNFAPGTMPHPKTNKSASTTPASHTLPSQSVREMRSLAEFKPDFVKEQPEPPEMRVPFPPNKPQPMVAKKPHPKPVSPSPRPLPKKPVPPLPTPSTTHKPPQPLCPIPSLPNPTPTTQETVYEVYEEELIDTDDEWTYESLPQYNIYSS